MKEENKQMTEEQEIRKGRKERQRRDLKRNLMLAIPAIILAGISIAILVSFIQTKNQLERSNLNTDVTLTVEDGDAVNIDYVGTIDGKEFSGSSTNGKSEDVVIGSGSYIDDFEEQLIGHHVGETVDVTVTFPEDYVDADLREKEAVFVTTINGIYR